MTSSTLTIGGKQIGPQNPPFVIAELSGNHDGSLDKALSIVAAAADSGADAIKLQTFTPATLTINSTRPEFFIDDPASLWHGRRLWDLYEQAHTPWDWHEPIFALARSRGLACISSVFDDTSVDFLLQIGVDAMKVSSFECVHLPLIEATARAAKPVVISTGMADATDLDDAVSTLRTSGASEFALLKCTSAYPSEEKDANVLTIPDMRSRYLCEVGLSDHSLRPYSAYAAVALGATIIEKHLTLNRNDGGVDSAFSLEPDELRQFVEGARLIWLSKGKVAYGPLKAEDTSLKERPSIYVVRRVGKGEKFTKDNTRIIRPGNGLKPKYYKQIVEGRSARDVEAETPMSWDLLDSAPEVR